jgi:molecular chaperone GrpE
MSAPAEELVPSDEEEAAPRSDEEVLQEEMALLEQQLQQMRDRYVRAVADLDNTRKRARQAIAEARQQGIDGVLLDLLALVDNFERALESVSPDKDAPTETKAIHDGIDLIYRQFMGSLERRGVKPIEALGEQFDPSLHEAVAKVPAGDDEEEGTVVLEVQKGYVRGDHVLRPSRVGVAAREPEQGSERQAER